MLFSQINVYSFIQVNMTMLHCILYLVISYKVFAGGYGYFFSVRKLWYESHVRFEKSEKFEKAVKTSIVNPQEVSEIEP